MLSLHSYYINHTFYLKTECTCWAIVWKWNITNDPTTFKRCAMVYCTEIHSFIVYRHCICPLCCLHSCLLIFIILLLSIYTTFLILLYLVACFHRFPFFTICLNCSTSTSFLWLLPLLYTALYQLFLFFLNYHLFTLLYLPFWWHCSSYLQSH